MKRTHCQIGAVTVKSAHRPAGVSFTSHVMSIRGVIARTWKLASVSDDGSQFRYERAPDNEVLP